MKILGVELSKPTFNQVTAAAVMAAGLWMAIVALLRSTGQPLDRVDAGAALLVIFWGCVCVRLGIRVDRGPRHLLVNLLCAGVLLAMYQFVVMLFTGNPVA